MKWVLAGFVFSFVFLSVLVSAQPLMDCGFEDSLTCETGQNPVQSSDLSFGGGKSGKGVVINESDVLAYPTFGNFNKDEGTIEFWVRPLWDGNDNQQHMLFNQYYPGGTFWFFKDDATNMLIFRIGTNSGSHQVSYDVSSWVQNEWHHLLATWNSYSGLSLYVDKLLADKLATPPFSIAGTSTEMFIGVRHDGGEQADSVIDQFMIYGEDITQNSIAYEITKPGYKVSIHSGGGLTIESAGEIFDLESEITSPGKDPNIYYNKLLVAHEDVTTGDWYGIAVTKINNDEYQIRAEHPSFQLIRKLYLSDSRIMINDTFTNKNQYRIGLKIANSMTDLNGLNEVIVSGIKPENYIGERTPTGFAGSNPTVFFSKGSTGIGVVAEDDVSRTHLYTNENGLDIRDPVSVEVSKPRTLEWSLYTGNGYFNFINKVRNDWNLNYEARGFSIGTYDSFWGGNPVLLYNDEGGVSDFMDNRGTEFIGHSHLRRVVGADVGPICLDDLYKNTLRNGVPVRTYLKNWADSIHLEDSRAKTIVSIHPSCSVDHGAAAIYPDSVAVDDQGNQLTYDYGGSGQAVRYVFFANDTNSWGDMFKDVVNLIFNEIGADGIWVDESNNIIMPYQTGSVYTYNAYDGSSVDLDGSGDVINTKASLVLITMDFRKRMWELAASTGKDIFFNNPPMTRTLTQKYAELGYTVHRENDRDSQGQPNNAYYIRTSTMQLTTPVEMISTSGSDNKLLICEDVRNNLDHGILTHPVTDIILGKDTIFSRMFPVFVQEIGNGFVRGSEKLIASKSGTYDFGDGEDVKILYYNGSCDLSSGEQIENTNQISLTLTSGQLAVAMKLLSGDLNNDGHINLFDLQIVTSNFGLTNTDTGWNATADVVADGEIDIYDLVFIASRFT